MSLGNHSRLRAYFSSARVVLCCSVAVTGVALAAPPVFGQALFRYGVPLWSLPYNARTADKVALCFDRPMPWDFTRAFNQAMLGSGTRYSLGGRWTSTATNGTGLSSGDPTVLTYSFMLDGTFLPGAAGEPSGPSDMFAVFDILFGSTAQWQDFFHQALQSWSTETGIQFVYEPNDDGADNSAGMVGILGVRGDIRIGGHFIDGQSGPNIIAYNFFPNHSEMVLDTSNTDLFGNPAFDALVLRNIVSHEIGHGIGLNHICPADETKLMEPFLSVAYDGPQHDDVRGGQRYYGDRNEHNDTPETATYLGVIDAVTVAVENVSIDDNLDSDYYRFTVAEPSTLSVTVQPVGFTYVQGPQDANCDGGSEFNSLTTHDLSVQVLDRDGTTVLGASDANPAGQPETLTEVVLPRGAGDYFVRVLPSATDNVQLYRMELSRGSPDCNNNGVPDDQDVAQGTSLDCNGNLFPDECEPDCNGNAIADECEVDTDGDAIIDVCDTCPLDNPDDTDGDGVCDSDDPCPLDDPDDTDGDGVCDSDDLCPGQIITLSGIDAILQGLHGNNASVSALVPDRFDFSEGQTGNNIIDGGEDMYDGGNRLNTNFAANIEYTNGAILAGDGLFGPGSQYFTAKHTGLFALVATDVSIASFTIEGNNGADGQGSADVTVLSTTRGTQAFTIYVKRVYGAANPSINHIFIVPGNGSGIIQTFTTNTNDDFHFLTGLSGIDQIYYLLVARANGGFLEDADIVLIVDEFVRNAFDCNGNGFADNCDAVDGASADCNGNLLPDECEPDCNGNAIADECDVAAGSGNDCNQNVVPDECELDTDGDAIIDECDNCPFDSAQDSDGDGVCDSVDACPGFDDSIDTDGDGNPDGCDPCPLDNPDDTDGDGVCDSDDPCPLDNPDDTDGDGVCDSDDPCPLDNPDDTDGDGVCNSEDPCPLDNPDDADGDGVCDTDDPCPGQINTVSSIAGILSGLNAGNASVSALVADRFDFSEGQTGNNILDGGEDMYDGGNRLNTNFAANIQYTNGAILAGDGLFGPGSQYFTAKHTGLFALVATDTSIASFTIEGNNGADGQGSADVTVLSTTRGTQAFTIYVKRVYGAANPSINHIFIVPGNGSGIIQTFTTNTNDDFHFLTGLSGINRIYYLLVARANGGFLEDADIVTIANEFLRVTFDCNGNTVPDECDVANGLSLDCNTNLFPDECELDTDGDALIDDCDNCPNEPALADPNEPIAERTCNDFVDNDCDGLTDTADADCAAPAVCSYTCGDIDGNGAVNLFDFAFFAGCFGRTSPIAQDCICSDLDTDGAVNLLDFATFSLTFSGVSTNIPPNCP